MRQSKPPQSGTDEVPFPERREAWSLYWARGHLHSCPGSYAGNYGGAIGAFWRGVMGGWTGADRVLDLGTGNGALVRLALEHGHVPQPPQLVAVDLAKPRPSWLGEWGARASRVLFLGGVRMESLPFADAVFTRIVSQFAVEYGEHPATLEECRRVLGPGGELAAVLHHADSLFAAVAREELRHLDWILGESGLSLAVGAALPCAAGRDPQRAEAARAGLRACLAALSERLAGAGVPDALLAVGQAALAAIERARRGELTAARAEWEAFCAELRAARLRSAELLAHALDAERAAGWREQLSRLGLRVDRLEPLAEEGGSLLGWALRARLP
ncbi:MAG: class I SAM-dependent methyltransferase [Xanthomonadales bacterium]|nr:class I SAM-dependent methyltransferase [Xanthomonadales bacterium]